MKKYKSRKGAIMTGTLVLVSMIPLFIWFFDRTTLYESPFMLLPLLAVVGFVLWAYFGTYYTFDGTTLSYRSAFLNGKIEITKIREIHYIKGFSYPTFKPALAGGGIVLKYNSFDDIYISPENQEDLIAELKKIKPEIAVLSKEYLS